MYTTSFASTVLLRNRRALSKAYFSRQISAKCAENTIANATANNFTEPMHAVTTPRYQDWVDPFAAPLQWDLECTGSPLGRTWVGY